MTTYQHTITIHSDQRPSFRGAEARWAKERLKAYLTARHLRAVRAPRERVMGPFESMRQGKYRLIRGWIPFGAATNDAGRYLLRVDTLAMKVSA
jgi:hypothetical protein